MRELVGPTDPAAFDNPSGELGYPYLPAAAYEAVLDFGCGCGRVARQLIQQHERPRQYLGIDLHRGMIEWCRQNLALHAPGFQFVHHDVSNASSILDPESPRPPPFPRATTRSQWCRRSRCSRTSSSAISPSTPGGGEGPAVGRAPSLHVVPLRQARLPDDAGLPERALHQRTRSLERRHLRPRWLRAQAASAGLTISWVKPPDTRGFQWTVLMTPVEQGLAEAEFPADEAPEGRLPSPLLRPGAARFGLADEAAGA
jgi:SAM-dependent methyltransferase